MSGSGHAAMSVARPASVLISATTGVTRAPVALAISDTASSRAPALRALMNTEQPSRASAVAQALPSPLEEAQTIALRPLMPRSMAILLACDGSAEDGGEVAGHQRLALGPQRHCVTRRARALLRKHLHPFDVEGVAPG